MRWTSVVKLTSTSGLPTPMRSVAAKTVTGDGQSTMSSSGTDHSTVPTAMSEARRLRLARAIASTPPVMAPAPNTVSMTPTASGPRSRISTAQVTPSTIVVPWTTFCAQSMPATSRRSRLPAISRKPPVISRSAP